MAFFSHALASDANVVNPFYNNGHQEITWQKRCPKAKCYDNATKFHGDVKEKRQKDSFKRTQPR